MTRPQRTGRILGTPFLILLTFILVGLANSAIADDSPPLDNNWRSDSPLLFTQNYHTKVWSTDTIPAPRASGYEHESRVGNVPWDIACGDLDRDGTDDLVFYDVENRLHALNGATGILLWMNSTPVRQEYGYIHNSIVVSDIDADGNMEVLYSESGGWLNIADGLSGSVVERIFVGAISTTPKLVDLDGDGRDEIIIGSVSSDFSPLITCINGRTMSPMWTYKGPMTVAKDPVVSDIDFDGTLEVLFVGGYHNYGDPAPRYYFYPSDFMIALDGLSGKVEWETRLPSIVGYYPVIRMIEDEERCEIFIPGGYYPKTGYIVDGETGSVIDTINDTGGGYFVYDDWDGDGIDEAFYRAGFYTIYGGLYIVDDGHGSCLISSSIPPTIAQFTLADWDGDGRSEVLFNSRDPIQRLWNIWMLGYGQANATKLWDGARFCFIGDLDGDGTSEMLIDGDGTIALIRVNTPTIEVAMSGLDFSDVTYPMSVVNEIDVTIGFQDPTFSVELLSISIGNESKCVDIDINVTSEDLHLMDGLDGAVRIIDFIIQAAEGGLGYRISIEVQFNWTYPIDRSSWISVGLGYHEAFLVDLPKAIEFRVEKGLEVKGIIRLSSESGEALPTGDWVKSGQMVRVDGISVLHKGSEIPAPFDAFGARLVVEEDVLTQVSRGYHHANLSMEFVVPLINEPLVSGLDLTVLLWDLTPGASSDGTMSVHLQIDNEPPVISEVQPGSGTWTNNPHVLCSALLSDGDGSGIDPTRIEILVDGIELPSLQVTSVKAIEEGYMASIAIEAGLNSEWVVRWMVYDLVSNERISESFSYKTDMDPPEIIPVFPRTWTNTSRVLVEARILDTLSGLRENLVRLDIYDEDATLMLSEEVYVDINGIAKAYMNANVSGVYRCAWSATDIAGNNGSYIQYVQVDHNAPKILATIPWIFNTTTGEISFSIDLDDLNGSGVNISTLRYRLDMNGSQWMQFDGVHGISRSTVTVDLYIQGDESIWISLLDLAGNSALSDQAYLLNLNEPPIVRLSQPIEGMVYSSTRITFDARESSDPEDLSLIYRWTLDGKPMDGWGAYETQKIEFGEHTVELEISDGFQKVELGPVVFHIEGEMISQESQYLILIIVCLVLVAIITVGLRRWRITEQT